MSRPGSCAPAFRVLSETGQTIACSNLANQGGGHLLENPATLPVGLLCTSDKSLPDQVQVRCSLRSASVSALELQVAFRFGQLRTPSDGSSANRRISFCWRSFCFDRRYPPP